jgi:hypothetical protein
MQTALREALVAWIGERPTVAVYVLKDFASQPGDVIELESGEKLVVKAVKDLGEIWELSVSPAH